MESSNPAFRGLREQPGGLPGVQTPTAPTAAYLQEMYGQPSTGAPARERFLTLDDVVAKTAVVLGVGIVAAVLAVSFNTSWALVVPAAITGLVLAMFIIFKQSTNPALILSYAAVEGVLLGAITAALESNPKYAGIGLQALVGTLGVFAGMLIVYKTGAIRVTPKFTKMLVGAMIGIFALVLFDLIAGAFGTDLHLRDGGTMSIVLTLVIIVVAALSFLLDFDQIDRAIKVGAPASAAWYFAFGLMVTLVWLYLEILQLLGFMRNS